MATILVRRRDVYSCISRKGDESVGGSNVNGGAYLMSYVLSLMSGVEDFLQTGIELG